MILICGLKNIVLMNKLWLLFLDIVLSVQHYIEIIFGAVADAWHKSNIRTWADLDMYYEKQEKLNIIKKSISKKLGLNRSLTQYEEEYKEKWTVDFGFSLDIIELALKRTTSKSNPSFDYIDKILCDWNDRNLKTINDIQNFLEQMKVKKAEIKNLEKKAYNNYEQRKYDNFDNLYANAQKA